MIFSFVLTPVALIIIGDLQCIVHPIVYYVQDM